MRLNKGDNGKGKQKVSSRINYMKIIYRTEEIQEKKNTTRGKIIWKWDRYWFERVKKIQVPWNNGLRLVWNPGGN